MLLAMARNNSVSDYLAEIGRKGGQAKVRKGTAMLTGEQRKELGRKGAAVRWGKKRKKKAAGAG
jgi:general stress protein YciG